MQTFQELILKLSEFWAAQGCVLQQPYDLEVGAGTMHPDTFLRVLGPEPWRVAYVQPSRRPADGRYGENPFRLGKHYQFQVILKPAPADIQRLYVESLEAMGVDLSVHDLRFEEDNWEAPTLGAWGVGWQVMLDGMEITQFTYFQQAGGLDLAPISAEITYGLERITMFLGLARSIYDIGWVPGGVAYGQVRHQDEVEFSKFYFEVADVAFLQAQFEGHEREARRCLEAGLVLPAYECALKCSHAFNVLDARGAVSVTERVAIIKRVRALAVACAKEYVASRERLGFPLLAAPADTGRATDRSPLHPNGRESAPSSPTDLVGATGGSPSSSPRDYLLEVRAEEIPARMLAPAAAELAAGVGRALAACGLAPASIETAFTPRRLVLVARGVPAREPDREERVVGPPVSAAFDASGAPTRAGVGFAARCGVAPEALLKVTTEKGEYAAAVVATVGRPAAAVLADTVPSVLAGLSWSKSMHWGVAEGPWVRPVHGVVSLLGDEVVPFDLFGVAAGAETVGHGVLSPAPFAVSGADDHRERLRALGLEIDPAARREALRRAMERHAAELGGRLVEDGELLDKLAAICEIPGVMAGGFDPAFLDLPREVLATSLRDHQSALTVEEADGRPGAERRLLPVFLTVMDRPDDPVGRVRAGNEWVVAARLADARFFVEEDRKTGLAARADGLARLGFHEKLGSYAAKSRRIAALAAALVADLGWPELAAEVAEASRLLKADLVAETVKEFTTLQGVMGGIYAREEGRPEGVWQAIYDQYLPASTDDALPRGRVGRVVGLADRLDTLAGIFGLGLVPTGSRDPFGLRRAAQGAVRIALEGGLALDLEAAARRAVALYGDALRRTPDEVLADLGPFLADRVRHLLGLKGYAYDEIEAALAARGGAMGELPDLGSRVAALHGARDGEAFLAVVLAAKRIANIVKDQEPRPLDAAALAASPEPAERALHLAFEGLRATIDGAAAARDYGRALAAVADLAPVLDRFFVEVLVMDEDPVRRSHRLALLQAIDRTISATARLTEVVVDKAEHRAKFA